MVQVRGSWGKGLFKLVTVEGLEEASVRVSVVELESIVLEDMVAVTLV
jgi:hypothetical protein